MERPLHKSSRISRALIILATHPCTWQYLIYVFLISHIKLPAINARNDVKTVPSTYVDVPMSWWSIMPMSQRLCFIFLKKSCGYMWNVIDFWDSAQLFFRIFFYNSLLPLQKKAAAVYLHFKFYFCLRIALNGLMESEWACLCSIASIDGI